MSRPHLRRRGLRSRPDQLSDRLQLAGTGVPLTQLTDVAEHVLLLCVGLGLGTKQAEFEWEPEALERALQAILGPGTPTGGQKDVTLRTHLTGPLPARSSARVYCLLAASLAAAFS